MAMHKLGLGEIHSGGNLHETGGKPHESGGKRQNMFLIFFRIFKYGCNLHFCKIPWKWLRAKKTWPGIRQLSSLKAFGLKFLPDDFLDMMAWFKSTLKYAWFIWLYMVDSILNSPPGQNLFGSTFGTCPVHLSVHFCQSSSPALIWDPAVSKPP